MEVKDEGGKTMISVVIPIYRNEPFIDGLYSRLTDNISAITVDFEIIFVDDRSPDNSWKLIARIAEKDRRVKGIRFPRNFGQHFAIIAGVAHSSGDWVVVMDGDLQDRPEEIINLYNKALEGYDVVFARRQIRKDNLYIKLCSRMFYKFFDFLVGSKSDATVANFGIYSRKVIVNFNKLREHSRLFPLFINWLGFKTAYIDVEHAQRSTGKSAYTIKKKMALALDTIISMSNKPLKISIKIGLLLSFLSFLYGVFMIIKYLVWGIPVIGWTSLIVSLYFIGGLILSTLGILGIYIGKIFDEVKNRPIYVIDETINLYVLELNSLCLPEFLKINDGLKRIKNEEIRP
ncbi:MAG TPA: glycosyltransferase family 2 protein [Candidatus Kapabacteria bacterium]|nr:glycosyltransferase family 2 protein [Candidatus Kapabacteria bacterium]